MIEEKDLINYDEETKNDIIEYISLLNEIELKALKIAKNHLKTSFNIYKSNGFQKFLNNKNNKNNKNN
jgi:hypothetical protein